MCCVSEDTHCCDLLFCEDYHFTFHKWLIVYRFGEFGGLGGNLLFNYRWHRSKQNCLARTGLLTCGEVPAIWCTSVAIRWCPTDLLSSRVFDLQVRCPRVLFVQAVLEPVLDSDPPDLLYPLSLGKGSYQSCVAKYLIQLHPQGQTWLGLFPINMMFAVQIIETI